MSEGTHKCESWDDENHATEDNYGYDDDRHTDVRCYPYIAEDSTDWPDIDLGTFQAGDSDWFRRDEIDAETLGACAEEE